LPFSHTFEGVANLDHHRLGIERVGQLGATLEAHGIRAESVIAVLERRRPSPLGGTSSALKLDHLESFLRSGQAHGRTRELPSATLERLDLLNGAVSTNSSTAAYLSELIVGEARSQSSAQNIVTTGVLRQLAREVCETMSATQHARVGAMTDHEFLSLILSRSQTRAVTETLLRTPDAWFAQPASQVQFQTHGCIEYELSRLYLGLPLVGGRAMESHAHLFQGLPAVPAKYLICRKAC